MDGGWTWIRVTRSPFVGWFVGRLRVRLLVCAERLTGRQRLFLGMTRAEPAPRVGIAGLAVEDVGRGYEN